MQSSNLTFRSCPICDATSGHNVAEVIAKQPAELSNNEDLKDSFIGFRKDQCFFSYVRCAHCGLLYNSQYFSPDNLSELYSSMPENTFVSGERDSVKTQMGYAKYFGKRKHSTGYLEIGADIGLLTRPMVSKFSFTNVNLVEPNKSSHAELLLHATKNSKIYLNIDEVPALESHSHVAAVHVLDHLVEPKRDLMEISGRMEPGATLVAIVHNEKSLLRKLLKQSWPPFCLQHPQLFNKRTVTKLLLTAGLRVESIKRTRNYIAISQGIDLFKRIGILPQRFRVGTLNFSVPVYLGNIAVIATKI